MLDQHILSGTTAWILAGLRHSLPFVFCFVWFGFFLLTQLKQMQLPRNFSAFFREAVADRRGSDHDVND